MFGGVGGLVVGAEGVGEGLELCGGFAGNDGEAGPDGVLGGGPWEGQRERIGCRMEYPLGVGSKRRRFMSISAGMSNVTAPVGERLASGEWFRFRLQIFPDGTCGVAIDGQPVWRSTTPRLITERHHLVLEGSSVDTEVLIGKVEGWYGVRDDVKWARLNDD